MRRVRCIRRPVDMIPAGKSLKNKQEEKWSGKKKYTQKEEEKKGV